MGKPGMRLKIPMMRLMRPKYRVSAQRGRLMSRTSADMDQKNTAMIMLERGPTKAMLNSLDGLSGSPFNSATPPRMNRVILRTSSPCLLATREWVSSWPRTEAKKSRLVTNPITQYCHWGQPPKRLGK